MPGYGLKEFVGEVLVIGNDQGFGFRHGIQDESGEVKQARRHLSHRHGRGGQEETDWLMGFGVEAEEGRRDLVGADGGIVPVAWHLPLAGTGQAMRVDGQQATLKVATGPPEATEGKLKFFCLPDGMRHEQIVNALIRDNKGEAVEEFESFLAERTSGSHMNDSESRFVNQLQSHAGGQARGRASSPACQQVPGSQAQVFGCQQPEPDQIARNLIGQQLADAALDAEAIEFFAPVFSESSMGLQLDDRALGMELIEFFFAARTAG